MNFKPIKKIVLILGLVLVSGGVGYKLGMTQVRIAWQNYSPSVTVVNRLPSTNPVDFSLFWGVWDEIMQKYVDKSKLDTQKMVFGAISGMVSSLGDPYTVFLPPQQNRAVKEDLNGSFEGIGAQLATKDRRITIVAPLSDSPAQKAGLRTGDWIVKIDGQDSASLTLPEAVAKIRGPKGSAVVLNVFHQGDARPKDVGIVRDTIVLKSVIWNVATSTASANLKPVVHLQLNRFGDPTDAQWDQAAGEISGYLATSSGKIAGLVLDVRGNPGGYLAESVYTAGEFLSSGVVVKQQDYRGDIQTYSVDRHGKLLAVPMVVLVDGGTASAAEILSGALQAAGRAKIIGIQTFGKGSVQVTEDLPQGTGLHITVAKWLLANDVWINGAGLTPDTKIDNDVNMPDRDLQLDKAIQVLNGIK